MAVASVSRCCLARPSVLIPASRRRAAPVLTAVSRRPAPAAVQDLFKSMVMPGEPAPKQAPTPPQSTGRWERGASLLTGRADARSSCPSHADGADQILTARWTQSTRCTTPALAATSTRCVASGSHHSAHGERAESEEVCIKERVEVGASGVGRRTLRAAVHSAKCVRHMDR